MKDEDTELIKKAQAGDRSAFEALLREHYDVMFRMAFKWCGNRADAEDITQNACLKLARSIGGFRFESAFTSWLYRLVVNAAMDWKKANKTHGEIPETMSDGGADAEQDMQTKEGLALVLALPEKEKTALLLVFGEGMTHAEAAFVMECKESTVSWYIHEARKKLGVKERKMGHG